MRCVFLFALISSCALTSHNLLGQQTKERALLQLIDSLEGRLYDDKEEQLTENSLFENAIEKIKSKALALKSNLVYFEAQRVLYSYYIYSKDTLMSMVLLNEVINEAKEKVYPKAEVDFLHRKGIKFLEYHEYDSAFSLFNEALALAKNDKYHSIVPYILNSKSVAYANLKDYDSSIEQYKMALEYIEKFGDPGLVGVLFANILVTYIKLEEADSIISYAWKTREIAKKQNSKWQLLTSYDGLIAAAYLKRGYDDVLAYSDTLINIVKEENLDWSVQDTYYYLSKTYHGLKETDSSSQYIEKAIAEAKKAGDIKSSIQYLKWSVNIKKKYKQYESALGHSEMLNVLMDSLDLTNKKKQLHLISLTSKLKEREKTIQLFEMKGKLYNQQIYYRNIVIVLSGLLFTVLVMGGYIYFSRRVTYQKTLAREAQSRLLLTQLEPHFVFNALTSVQYFLLNKNNSEEALKYLQRFSTLIRRILNSTRNEWVSLEEEIESISIFLDIHMLRLEGAFSYNIHLEKSEEIEDILIPPMLIQPFIENAINHGIRGIEQGKISISICQKKDILFVTIDDNGLGLGKGKVKRKHHLSHATNITKERIEIIKKLLKKRVSFSVSNREGTNGVRVFLELPIMFKQL